MRAERLVRRQADAAQHFMRAELLRLLDGTTETQRKIAGAFWERPSYPAAAAVLSAHKAALDRHHLDVYLAALKRSRELGAALRALVRTSHDRLRGIVATQATIRILIDGAPADADDRMVNRLRRLSADAGTLGREAVAAHLAALRSLLEVAGLGLDRRVPETFERAGSAPLHGRIHAGKRASMERLAKLPEGMLVRVEGAVSAIAPPKGTDRGFRATLKDSSEATVEVAAPSDLARHGLQSGRFARLTGVLVRPEGGRTSRIDVEEMDVGGLYAHDVWKIAFLDLAAPLYNVWPQDLHIAFEAPAGFEDDEPGAGKAWGSPCKSLGDDYTEAMHDLDAANQALDSQQVDVWLAGAACLLACATAETPITMALCVTAFLNLNNEIDKQEQAEANVAHAQQVAQQAHDAYMDCLNGQTSLPWSHSWGNLAFGGGSAGNTSGGGGVHDDGTGPDQSMPDWIMHFGEDDPWWFEEPGPDPDPDPPFVWPEDVGDGTGDGLAEEEEENEEDESFSNV